MYSEKLKIPLARLYSIASFYAQFSFNPKGKYIITVCDGTACHVKGSMLLVELVNREIKDKARRNQWRWPFYTRNGRLLWLLCYCTSQRLLTKMFLEV